MILLIASSSSSGYKGKTKILDETSLATLSRHSLCIYGAHGLAQEVNIIAKKINYETKRWTEILYIDDINDMKDIHGTKVYKLEKLLDTYDKDELEMVIAVGEPAIRELLYRKAKEKKIRLVSLVHPGVYIDETTEIGEGVVVCEGVTITCNVKIGDNTYIQPHAVVGHDIKIGKHTVYNIFRRVFLYFLTAYRAVCFSYTCIQ